MSSTIEASSGMPPPLRHHLEKLPQELYDHIYNLTFTAQPGIRYVSKPPEGASEQGRKARPHFIEPDNVGLLHVDRLSRQKFAHSYYGSEGAVFVYDVTGNILRANEPLRDMSSYIAPEHHQLVKDIRCVFAQPKIPASDERLHSRNSRNSQTCLNKAAAAFGGDGTSVLRCGKPSEVTEDLDGFQDYSAYGVELPAYPYRKKYVCGHVPFHRRHVGNGGQA